MWSSWSENAAKSLTQALEKTGDAISKAATNAGKSAQRAADASQDGQEESETSATETTTTTTTTTTPVVQGRYAEPEGDAGTPSLAQDKQKEILKNLQMGWTSMVQEAKHSIKVAQEKIEEEQQKITQQIQKARSNFYKRDLSLPLDVPALKDAEVVYLTDRLITMSHPAMASSTDPDISGARKLAAIGHLLQRRHDGRYMVWNISEVDYDIDILDDQVLTFSFPGSPSPPLGLLLKILISMEAWLKADDRNVAVVHCLTGKGRTSTVLAAFLCWMGEAGFGDIYEALQYIATCKQLSPEELTIPSQRRYASYFKNMLDNVRPSQPPLMLKRVIMSEAPRFAKGPPLDHEGATKEGGGDGGADSTASGSTTASSSGKKLVKSGMDPETLRLGCAPYLQVFKAGKLLHTAPASLHYQQSPDELPFCQIADGQVSFVIDQIVQGDILLRCRHLTVKKQRVSMFRAAFHTGYVPPKVMRLTKSQLDGACNDARFPEDFFLDLIFEPVDAEAASKMLEEGQKADDEGGENEKFAEDVVKGSRKAGALASGSKTVRASSYDTMLHRDSRFWDVIAARREQHDNQETPEDPMFGPTVGRRRKFDGSGATKGGGAAGGTAPGGKAEATKESAEQKALETFSIGGEFDFLPEVVEPEQAMGTPEVPAKPAKKDSLMEALMGALDDDDDDNDDAQSDDNIEEIVFGDVPGAEPTMAKLPDVPGQTSSSADEAEQPATPAAAMPTTDTTTQRDPATKEPPSKQTSTAGSSQQAISDMEDLLAAANLDVDMDMDALLAGGDDDDFNADDLLAMDDAELEDLESFLTPKK